MSNCRSGRCSASSTARPAGGRGRAPTRALSSAGSPPKQVSGAASHRTSCATPTPSSSRARAWRSTSSSANSATRISAPPRSTSRHRHRRDHRHRPRPARADDVRQRRPAAPNNPNSVSGSTPLLPAARSWSRLLVISAIVTTTRAAPLLAPGPRPEGAHDAETRRRSLACANEERAARVPELTAAAPELHRREKPRLVTVDERGPGTGAERCSRPRRLHAGGDADPEQPEAASRASPRSARTTPAGRMR